MDRFSISRPLRERDPFLTTVLLTAALTLPRDFIHRSPPFSGVKGFFRYDLSISIPLFIDELQLIKSSIKKTS